MLWMNHQPLHTPGVDVFGRNDLADLLASLLAAEGMSIGVIYDDFRGEPFVPAAYAARTDRPPMLYALGLATDMRRRGQRFRELQEAGVRMASFISPQAVRAPDVRIGNGCIVLAGSVMNARAVLGDAVLLNIGVLISHHSQLDDNVAAGPGAVVCGRVTVRRDVALGSGCTIIDHLEIGAGSLVAAGAVVIDHIPAGSRVAGVPARPMSARPGTASA